MKVPISLHRRHASLPTRHLQVASRRQQPHAVEERAIGEEVLEGEILGQALEIERAPSVCRGPEDALISEANMKRVADLRVVERLHAEAVARQRQRLLVAIPDGEREHAVEPPRQPQAPVGEGVQQAPRCRVRLTKAMAARRQARRAVPGSCRSRRCRRACSGRPRSPSAGGRAATDR